jgi:hypothetical protein
LRGIPSLITTCVLLIVLISMSSARATGLYEDYISYFSPADTVHKALVFRQSDIQRDAGRAAILSAELALRPRPRILLRVRVPFPTIKMDEGYEYGIGDGTVRAEARVRGDTLNAAGIFLVGDVRLPMGAKSFRPISYGSLDGGAGLELRSSSLFFRFRFASTYTLVGDRVRSGPFVHDNFLTLAFSMETELPRGASISFEGFGLFFRRGEKREMYTLSLKKSLSENIDAAVSGALEAGTDEERVYNSQISLAVRYLFPFSPEEEPPPDATEPERVPSREFDEK